MDLTDEQAELLIALVQRFPDVGNAALMKQNIVPPFAIHLHWDNETTSRVYNELKSKGAIYSPGPPYDFISNEAQNVAMKLMKDRHHANLQTASHIETKKSRREIKLVVLGAIIAFIPSVLSGLAVNYFSKQFEVPKHSVPTTMTTNLK